MANIKISALTPVTTVVPGTDVAPLVSGGITTKATPQQIVNAGLLAPGAIGGTTRGTAAFTTELVGPSASANFTRFPNALTVISNTSAGIQQNETHNMGIMAEGTANAADTSIYGVGVYGAGYTASGTRCGGVVGEGHVSASADTGSAIGVRGYANDTHAGGLNIGLYGDCANGSSNYALYLNNGDIYTAGAKTWSINGNLTFSGGYTVTMPALSVSTTVSGTGFTTYLASPPDIGGTAAAKGTFTSIFASSASSTYPGSLTSGIMMDYTSSLGRITVGTSSDVAIYNGGPASRTLLATFKSAGNIAMGIAAKGIDYSVNTPNAGMTNQVLSSYEEGTWTPSQGAGLTVVGAFSSSGKYTKVGRMVQVSGSVTGATSVAITGGQILCGNLPFTANSNGSAGSMINSTVNASGVIFTSSTNIYAVNTMSATTSIAFSVVYFV